MRNSLACLLFLYFYCADTLSQNTNIGLQYIDKSTGTTHNYNTSNINSDFGHRLCSGCSIWHKGIDLNRDGSSDHGDRIITPVSGTIAQIYHNNTYIVLVIDGPDNQDYGYGHIFEDYSNDALPIVLGNFVLAKMNAPNANSLAIIDILNNRAFSTISNGTVKYNNLSFTTSKTVEAGWPVAPVGNSNAINGTHLHLYLLDKPKNEPQNNNNAKNPLHYLSHQTTNFDISIGRITKLTEYNQNTYYSGAEQGSIMVKAKMAGAGNGSIYTNHIMDIEKVHLYIKKYGQNDNDYKLILGNNFESKIVLGGRIDNTRYPSGNSSYDIASAYGSITRTGIEPFAYSSFPYDNWYFSDIYTRIHKDDRFTGTIKLASCNAEARYSDGVYLIKPRAFRIDNTEAVNPANPNNNTPKQIIIDNFRPYIANVKIKEDGSSEFKYSRGWQWIGNRLLFEPEPTDIKFSNTKDVIVEVTTSEPMQNVSLQIGNYFVEQNCDSDLNKTTWLFSISKFLLTSGLQTLRFTGEDLAGNPLQSNPAVIPIRQENGNWAPAPLPGEDTFHKFIYGISEVDFVATQVGYMFNTIEFKDASTCSNNCNYYWNFGEPGIPVSSNKDVTVTYPNIGVYLVRHGVGSLEVSKHISVNSLSQPKSKFVYSPLFPDYLNRSTVAEVDFFSTSEGLISSYYWDFGNGVTSTEKDPTKIEFELNTTYSVTLTVSNALGSDTYRETLYLDPTTFPFISIFPWELSYFHYDIEITASNFDANQPIIYEIDFGDGTSDYYESYPGELPAHTFPHSYFSIGEFVVLAKATGYNNQGLLQTVTNAKRIKVQPDNLMVTISANSQNSPPYPLQEVIFNAAISPSCATFYGFWHIYKTGDPLFYKSIGFTSDNAPALVYKFPSEGKYRIILDVFCSGNSSTGIPSIGHSETEIEIVNAPDYIDIELYGRNNISQNSSFTFEAMLWPVGEPGVPNTEWWPTDVRWTLVKPNGQKEIVSKKLVGYESQYLQYQNFDFPMSGNYQLLIEAWNDQHGYTNELLNPMYVNTLCYYDFEELQITVSPAFPALKIITPALPYVDNLSASGTNDILLEFTNPGTSAIRWEVQVSNPSFIAMPIINSGINLNSGTIASLTLDVLPNILEESRFSVITIIGLDNSGNHVQGSPAYIQVYQNGTTGANRDYLYGDDPGHAFGYSVSIDGLRMLIGSPASSVKGKAFVFERNQFGDWVKSATLIPSNNNINFGKSVEIFGDYAIVGGPSSGTAYIYKKPAGGWSGTLTETKLINTNFNDLRNINVSIWGDYAVIGAPYHNDRGRVQIYYRNEGGTDNWGLCKVIDGQQNNDEFGASVDIYNDLLAIGAPQGGWNRGYINMYDRNLSSPNLWNLIQTLSPEVTSNLQDMKFGAKVSVFEDAVVTAYHAVTNSYNHHYLYLPIWLKNSNNQFELIDEGYFWLRYQTYYNCISSVSLFKEMNSSNPDLFKLRAVYGSETRDNNAGLCGSASFNEHLNSLLYDFQWIYEIDPNMPGDFYGKSVSNSYNTEITGIPGYNRNGKYGAVVFQKITDIKSNSDADIGYDLVNFIKPAGDYSVFNAAHLSLGGRNMPAIIESGANIHYESAEILLKNGFLADRNSNFVAQSLQKTVPDNSKILDAQNGVEDEYIALKKAFVKLLPDFPWYKYNIIQESNITATTAHTELNESISQTLQMSSNNDIDSTIGEVLLILCPESTNKVICLPKRINQKP